ncbi:hypothetical protein IFM89_036403 [Coptis chinensis]|uniref:Uncharacterized protein n=1 Tax=Coptis chinensis TaxID=261450 RepID=A0A835IJ81_9MAGN|nr:hypothetical protein IFM89_036403 [Coptis chinensis]
MEKLVGVEGNEEKRVEEILDANNSSVTSSPGQVTDPVVYKLVRVDGDGKLVPATDDEVMEVENLFEEEKVEAPSVTDTGQVEGCVLNEESIVEAKTEVPEGKLQGETTKVDGEKLNARLEYIGEMLQKVKHEEKLRLSSGRVGNMIVGSQCSDQTDKCVVGKVEHQTRHSLQENVPLPSPRLTDHSTNQLGSGETCLKPTDDLEVSGSIASSSCSSSMPDFSRIKGEICLDDLTVKELQETFRATFGRETLVKDKLWLKRRIAMGLTNSCNVSTTTFTIKDNILVGKKAKEAHCDLENTKNVNENENEIELLYNSCKDSPTIPTLQIRDRQVVSGKRSRIPQAEYESKSEDVCVEQSTVKRVRKPTKRYIEELSEAETRECSESLVTSVKDSGHVHSYPKPRVRSMNDVSSDGIAVVTREDSLGGSGVQVPYVSRVRRGRPREDFMSIMQYHPSGTAMEAGLVQKTLGPCTSRQDSESGIGNWSDIAAFKHIQQQVDIKRDQEKEDLVKCIDEQEQQIFKVDYADSFEEGSDYNVALPTSNDGFRRKHHRAWTLCEVIKLVEGVSKYGAGRWSEIKKVSFASYTYRTSVDLKDKWRNLLRASFAQTSSDKGTSNSRKHGSMPIPAPILLRVRQLAEKHSQVVSPLSSSKLLGCSERSVQETKSGYL